MGVGGVERGGSLINSVAGGCRIKQILGAVKSGIIFYPFRQVILLGSPDKK